MAHDLPNSGNPKTGSSNGEFYKHSGKLWFESHHSLLSGSSLGEQRKEQKVLLPPLSSPSHQLPEEKRDFTLPRHHSAFTLPSTFMLPFHARIVD